MRKYPRTPHLEGSRRQPGDEDMTDVALERVRGRHLVIEEKLDGSNAGLSFDELGQLQLQSRGHYLTGGHRERHFNLFKTWAHAYQDRLWEKLGNRYLVYGEWLYAHHTIHYTELPHYFMEFDVWDHQQQEFLDTPRRRQLLDGLPIVPVPVLYSGSTPGPLESLIGRSLYSPETAEGLYIKVEEGGQVVERYKFVRASFLTAVVDSGGHWLDRPIVPNGLAAGVTLW